MDYQDYIARKTESAPPVGIEPVDTADHLYPFQCDIVEWALRRGRAAIFADCGLGKTPIQLEWARQVSSLGKVLILAPLAVSEQTKREGVKFGVQVGFDHDIHIINYDRLHHISPDDYVGVVIDESSILKSFDGATRNAIITAFEDTPYRLACTATPAPNDHMELGNHSEFLGIKSRAEMLAEFFVHDGARTSSWRLKGHAQDVFWDWVTDWAVMVRKPSDLGYDDGLFTLPPLIIKEHVIRVDHTNAWDSGALFQVESLTLTEQRNTRRSTLDQRVDIAKDIAESSESCLIWCEYNIESDELTKSIDNSAQVRGSDDRDVKSNRLLGFCHGEPRTMITKPSIAGFGMNWQHCSTVVFIGASHSYEQTYQAIRRCWRFGQTKPVTVHIICAETDGAVIANLKRKEAEADSMGDEMASRVKRIQRRDISQASRDCDRYNPTIIMELPSWLTPTY